jgi:hypothetical protein
MAAAVTMLPPATKHDRPFKRCGCGKSYDIASWQMLPFVSRWNTGDEVLELRNCTCSSTLAVEVR